MTQDGKLAMSVGFPSVSRGRDCPVSLGESDGKHGERSPHGEGHPDGEEERYECQEVPRMDSPSHPVADDEDDGPDAEHLDDHERH